MRRAKQAERCDTADVTAGSDDRGRSDGDDDAMVLMVVVAHKVVMMMESRRSNGGKERKGAVSAANVLRRWQLSGGWC